MSNSNSSILDENFIYNTQTMGNINTEHEYIMALGSIYTSCVHIVGLPDEFTDFWITKLTQFDNSMLVLDHHVDESIDYSDKIKNSVTELEIQWRKASTTTEKDEINADLSILRGLSQDLNKKGVKIRELSMRLFIYGKNREDLAERTNSIINSMSSDGFKGNVFLDENDDEYRSIFLPSSKQIELRNHRKALPMPTPILGLGFGHNQTSLSDSWGSYFGYTGTGGLVYWDLFEIAPGRFYYNFFLSGDMGSGKSTTLKKIIQDRLIRGDMVRVFDKSGEFRELVDYYNGQTISLNGSDGIINMFQVYPAVIKEDSSEVDVQGSYTAHLASLAAKYRLLADSQDNIQNQVNVFKDICDRYYEKHGFLNNPKHDITSFPPEDYPTASDIYMYIEETREKEKDQQRASIYNNISIIFKPLTSQYKALFDGTTSIREVDGVDLVSYDIQSIEKYDENIQDLQIFNAINTANDNCMKVGREEKRAYDSGTKTLDEVKHFLICVDECHNLLNINKGFVVKHFLTLMSEARKFFGGIGLATQRLERMFPMGSNASSRDTVEAVNNLNQLYGLCQYKVILKHDITSIGSKEDPGIMRKIYSSFLQESDYQSIPNFKSKGDAILVTGNENLRMHFDVTEKELALFNGGA